MHLSDIATRIHAILSENINELGDTGSLIQLLEFEMITTPVGPRSERIGLLINRFQYLGYSEPRSLFVPRSIDSVVPEAIKLLEMRAHEKAAGSQNALTGSTATSRA